jgi:hypothetical protein
MTVPSVQPNSAAVSSTTTSSQNTQNTWDLKKIAIIALPIIASLASFVFLPLEIAIIMTAVVTIGAIMCYKRQNAPAVAPTQPLNIQAPRKIRDRHIVDSLQAVSGRSVLNFVLQSHEEVAEFCKQYGAQFTDCKIEKGKDPKWPEINIIPKEGKTCDDVLNRLLKIFPGCSVEES